MSLIALLSIYKKKKTLRCKSLSDVQISYSDIVKIKYENTELTKYGNLIHFEFLSA